MTLVLESSWKEKLQNECAQPYFGVLAAFVRNEYQTTTVYPHPKALFRAFDLCPFSKVRVVILGQDPYHGTGQANGLCFSVNEGVPLPPSLQNIFKELASDLGVPVERTNGDLSYLVTRGVLLLNATLTVRAGSPGSHQGRGWETFTDAVIRILSEEREHLVFILWGNYAKAKGAHVDRNRHCVIESAHPSPFSAANGFFSSRPFSRANTYLVAQGQEPIDWL